MFTTQATSCFPENQPAQHLPLAWHFVAEVERICTETLDLHLKEHQFNEVWGSRDSEESGLVFHIMSSMLKHETMGPRQPNKIKSVCLIVQLMFLKCVYHDLSKTDLSMLV